MMSTEHDPVSKPKHYTSGASEIGRPALKEIGFTADDFEIECLQALNKDKHRWILKDAFVFSVVRYLWRAGLKDDLRQDLEKALFYIRLAIVDEAQQRSTDLKMRLSEMRWIVNKASFVASFKHD